MQRKNSLNKIISEAIRMVLAERQVKIDRFDEVAKRLKFTSPDQFYFLSIMKRRKDNPHDDRSKGNYGQGAWYIKNYRIFSPQDLLAIKNEVIDLCEKNNARACITINPRSASQTDAFITKTKAAHPSWTHVEDRIPAQAKKGGEWVQSRPKALVDVDVADKHVHNEVINILKSLGIEITDMYVTPSGGLHVEIANGYEDKVKYAKQLFANLCKGKHKYGRLADVGMDLDAFKLTYSNVNTPGY